MGPEPIAAMAYMPTIATAYNTGLPVSTSGITPNDHARHPAHPSNIIRRRPTRSHRVAESATDAMLASPPSTPTIKMTLREYPRWEWA